MSEPNSSYEDKFIGCLVGLAIGDALGSPLEGKSRAEILEQYGQSVREFLPREEIALIAGHEDYPQDGLPPGSTTEDTFLALALAESLVRTNGQVLPADFAPPMIAGLDTLMAHFFGRTTRETLIQARKSGLYQAGSDSERSAGNGVAVRIAALGLLHCYGPFQPDRFRQDCETVAQLTHRNPIAIQAGVAVAGAVRAMCRREVMPEDLMAVAMDLVPPGYLGLPLAGNPIRQKLIAAQDYIEERQTFVDNVLANDLEVDFLRVDLNNMERCGTHGYAPETMAAAFYAFVAGKDSFEEALVLAVNAGGDADSIGALAGALAGAYHGLAAIPERWKQGLAGYTKIVETARALHAVAAARL